MFLNPDWEYRLWTDDDLSKLVADHYPDLEGLFHSYPNPVQRADLGRYLILHHCGGIYADLDIECVAPLAAIQNETRIVFAEEPAEHHIPAQSLGLPVFLFNGVIASPKAHRFWPHLINVLKKCAHAKNYVLESTGPLALTGAYLSFDAPETISVNSCHLFNPITDKGHFSQSRPHGDFADHHLRNHYWRGSWYRCRTTSRLQRLKTSCRRLKYRLGRGPYLDKEKLRAQIDTATLYRPISPTDENVCILIPVRDAAPFLDRCFAVGN
ncbi:glycosyltransferase family 32 protein [Yoonia sp. BS5-3]|uniref:Glycosyltransferase family 32 protein n=1 Tax=Yoonia phaeophyticola TaxID=3137369 RepID=A0ABZ3IDI6_9RHOB